MFKNQLDQLNPSIELVQEQQKKVPYSVEVIGNSEDYEKWAIQRAEFEAKWQEEFIKREGKKRHEAYKRVENQDVTGLTLSQAEQDELEYRKTRDDDDVFEYKPRHTPGKWNEQNEAEKAFAHGLFPPLEQTKESFSDRIKKSLVKFFSEVFEK